MWMGFLRRLSVGIALLVVLLFHGAAAAGDAKRLRSEMSPYLRAHAADPLDWQTWGLQALKRARDKERLLFVLVGRSGEPRHLALERELLAEGDALSVLEREYVPVLVDGDQRPDLADFLRLAASLDGEPPAEALDGPLGAILTPEMRPILVMPAAPALAGHLLRHALEYRAYRAEVEERAASRLASLEGAQRAERPAATLSPETVDRALRAAFVGFDARRGTFARRPAHLPLTAVRLALAEAERSGAAEPLGQAALALEALAREGIHDHVGGGFFRQTSDPDLKLPRFEKRLGDNALLLDAFVRAHALTGRALFREAANGIADWALESMCVEGGAFAFAEQSSGDGSEGQSYLWNEGELRGVLGAPGTLALLRTFHLAPTGILTLGAADASGSRAQLARLREARARRGPPERDERVFAGANGLMIAALARSGTVLDRPGDVAAARRAAEGALERLGRPDSLRRVARGSEVGELAMLDDHAGLLLGLVELHVATHEARYLKLALALADEAERRFHDPAGGYFLNEAGHQPFPVRVKTGFDGDLPAANAVMAEGLLRLADVTGKRRHERLARETLTALLGDLERAPAGLLGLSASVPRLLGRDPSASQARPTETVRESRGALTIEVSLSRATARPGQSVDARIRLVLAQPWKLVAADPQDRSLAGLGIGVLTPGLTLETARPPRPTVERPRWSPVPVALLSGDVSLAVPIRVAAGAAPGESRVRLRVRYQLCDARVCSPPDSALIEVPFAIIPPVR